jgi:uncharacterized membrane protein
MGCYNALLVSTHCSHSAYTSLYMQIIRSIYVTILCLKRMFAIALPFYSKQASKHIHACSQFLYICTCYFLYSTHSSNVIYQLQTFLVVRKSRKNKSMSPELKKAFSFSLKYIFIVACYIVVACVVLSIPLSVHIGLTIHSTETTNTLDNANLAALWTKTMALMNCTFN